MYLEAGAVRAMGITEVACCIDLMRLVLLEEVYDELNVPIAEIFLFHSSCRTEHILSLLLRLHLSGADTEFRGYIHSTVMAQLERGTVSRQTLSSPVS